MAFESQRIESILDKVPVAYPGLTQGTLDQIQRWGRPFLEWCAAERTRPTASDMAALERYEATYPERFGRSRSVVRSQLGKVLRVADMVLPRPRGSGGVYAARLRELPERGRLADAVHAVMVGARDEKHRGQLRTTLGRFLLWCDERRIRPGECFEADLTAYRRSLQRAGLKSTGAEVDAAKRLLRALGVMKSAGLR